MLFWSLVYSKTINQQHFAMYLALHAPLVNTCLLQRRLQDPVDYKVDLCANA